MLKRIATISAGLLLLFAPISAASANGQITKEYKPGWENEDHRGRVLTFERIHRILTREGYGPVLSLRLNGDEYIARTYDARQRLVQIRLDKWTGRILKLRVLEDEGHGEHGLIDRAKERLEREGYRDVRYRRSEDHYFIFDARDRRAGDVTIKVERRSGYIYEIEYRRAYDHDKDDGWKSARDIEDAIYAAGFATLINLLRQEDCYVARAENRRGVIYELRIDGPTGHILSQTPISRR